MYVRIQNTKRNGTLKSISMFSTRNFQCGDGIDKGKVSIIFGLSTWKTHKCFNAFQNSTNLNRTRLPTVESSPCDDCGSFFEIAPHHAVAIHNAHWVMSFSADSKNSRTAFVDWSTSQMPHAFAMLKSNFLSFPVIPSKSSNNQITNFLFAFCIIAIW